MATLHAKDIEKWHEDGSTTVERQAIVDGRGSEIIADVADEKWRSLIICAVNCHADLLAVLKAIHVQLVAQGINFGPLIADAEAAIAKAGSRS